MVVGSNPAGGTDPLASSTQSSVATLPRMSETIVIDRRYRGPERSGNGGWSAGLVAAALAGPAEVTLRTPPPLDIPLEVRRTDGGATMHHGDVLVAEGVSTVLDLAPPRVVTAREATQATAGYAGFMSHAFSGCFVCGPDREEGDGLRIFPGPVAPGLVAAPWTPHPSLVDGSGEMVRPAVWAALDCPGGWAGDISEERPAVLGRLAVDVRRTPHVGEPLVVLGWAIEVRQKTFLAGSALQTADGEVLAVGRSTWVRVPPDWTG